MVDTTIAFGVGAAAIVTGVVLYFLAPSEPELPAERAGLEIQPIVTDPGVMVRYRF